MIFRGGRRQIVEGMFKSSLYYVCSIMLALLHFIPLNLFADPGSPKEVSYIDSHCFD